MSVTLTIDGTELTVPEGTLLVDAAKRMGADVPVFCYHPKMDPVGMCRVCLVEIGRPARDRVTGKPVLDEAGNPAIRFGPNLETACTTPVGEGWQVRVASDKAVQGRNEIVEYLLTSHPLDCPICDKGGECPLQNLTMEHGPGESRFLYDDKIHLAKHVPLGELIFLDRERCIQCARCTRFQDEIVDDPVIGFYERGRRLEIVTYSDPGFDSYFSGNTTDICPVGALTTADFRFGARPWELNSAASICPHCPVGCNLTLSTRREVQAGGRDVVKRIMPRQNEYVNEIWICDKGRFAHHFAQSLERLTVPLVRKNGKLARASWDEALIRATEGLKAAGPKSVGLASGRLTNEDLFNLRGLLQGLGGKAVLSDSMAGGNLVQRYGVGVGTNLSSLGKRDAVLVIAADLHEEAPVWWLRLKQAAERGATLIVANARTTRLDDYAKHSLRYPTGKAVHTSLGLLQFISDDPELARFEGDRDAKAAARAFKGARNAIVFFGQEGLNYAGSEALARACAQMLETKARVGRPKNGLVAVWPHANTQGAWDMGLKPEPRGLAAALEGAKAAYIIAADPASDEPGVHATLEKLSTLIVQDLFLTPTAKLADVVLPAQSFVERAGTFTNGERRVQRLYTAVSESSGSLPDWKIVAEVASRLEIELEHAAAPLVFERIAGKIRDYSELGYGDLSEVEVQWPDVGGTDLYFGGTAYANKQGLGVQLAPRASGRPLKWKAPPRASTAKDLLMVPVAKLYDRSGVLTASTLLESRIAPMQMALHPSEIERLGLSETDEAEISWDGRVEQLKITSSTAVPLGSALVPRSLPLSEPTPVTVRRAE
ncbi:MAG: NADH-quinone oxidoreductase subunit NuoG [Anaerolineales bacterium]